MADTRAFQRVVEHVQGAITGGTLKAGDRLPSERELGERFGIARSSVREALRVLESMELVRSAPRDPRGPLVLGASVGPVRRQLAMLTSTSGVRLPDLVALRMVVEASANMMAAIRRTPAQLVALERNLARMRESVALGYQAFSHADLEFHDLVAEAAGNQLLQVHGEVVRHAVLELIRQTILDAEDRTALMLRSLRQHGAVYAAIEARDGLLASRLARQTLYAYYAEHVEPADREIMAELVRECGGQTDP